MPVAMSSSFDQMDSSDSSKAPMSTPMPLSMAMPADMTSHPLSSTNKQSAQVDMLKRFHSSSPINIAPNPYQLAFSNQRVMHPKPSYMGFAHLSSSISMQHPMYANAASLLSVSKKQPAQRQTQAKVQSSLAINQTPQPLISTKKRPAGSTQAEPPRKVQTEAFESVRSKFRESLSAALAMTPNQQARPQASEKSPPKVSTEADTKNEANQDTASDVGPSGNSNEHMQVGNHDAQEEQRIPGSSENGVPITSGPIINDDLLLGHGLCWASDIDIENSEMIMNEVLKKPKLVNEEEIEMDHPKPFVEEVPDKPEETTYQIAESLAIKIEEELFKLFGGVNKKYKEKARSLLFNLKDRNNPELRERVLSGDIAPERLCSMTAEELASKELSQWRIAKAEELAQMVVLPNSDVDIRKLVRKTHKGEFQVEVDQDDSVSVEATVRQNILTSVPVKGTKDQDQSKTNEDEAKASTSEPLPVSDSTNLETLLSEDLMVDDLKDTEFLPPIISLDEFMQDLDSEPPFDNLSMNVEAEMERKLDSLEPKSDSALDNMTSKKELSENISGSKDHEDIATGITSKESSIASPDTDTNASSVHAAAGITSEESTIARPDSDTNGSSIHDEQDRCQPDVRARREQIWEGMLQLNVSALATVNCFFRSGEKASTQEWPAFLEIKGRVKLENFEKYLQELRLSRNRGIMIAQFCWMDGSHASGRLNICETINSYVADQRVGVAVLATGVELYFCPCHPKTIEILETHLPKDYTDALHSNIDNSLIGVVVWKKPYVNTISPRSSSHHKKKHSNSRKLQDIKNSRTRLEEEPIDDVPPGFGPGSARVNDDLPEYKFDQNTTSTSNSCISSIPAPPARPVEQMRELIEKYGNGGIMTKTWNDVDDIPEWQPNPNPNNPNPNQLQQQLLLPPSQPQEYNNAYQNQIMPLPFPSPMQMGLMQGQMTNAVNPLYVQVQNNNFNNGNQIWQPPGYSVSLLQMNGVQMMQPCNMNMNYNGQPINVSNTQFYGVSAPVQNMGWRPDVPRSSGV